MMKILLAAVLALAAPACAAAAGSDDDLVSPGRVQYDQARPSGGLTGEASAVDVRGFSAKARASLAHLTGAGKKNSQAGMPAIAGAQSRGETWVTRANRNVKDCIHYKIHKSAHDMGAIALTVGVVAGMLAADAPVTITGLAVGAAVFGTSGAAYGSAVGFAVTAPLCAAEVYPPALYDHVTSAYLPAVK